MGRRIPTVLDQLKTGASGEIAFTDSRGVRCIEAGGPEPGTGCAGRGIIVAMEEIRSRGLLDDRDVVLYDVLGDVVCGGFSMPLREQVADEVYLVTTSDFMALYAANNICRGIRKYAHSGRIRLAGIIHNGRSSVDNDSLLRAFAAELGTTVAGKIPMSPLIGQAELERRTVVDCAPESGPAQAFPRPGVRPPGQPRRLHPGADDRRRAGSALPEGGPALIPAEHPRLSVQAHFRYGRDSSARGPQVQHPVRLLRPPL